VGLLTISVANASRSNGHHQAVGEVTVTKGGGGGGKSPRGNGGHRPGGPKANGGLGGGGGGGGGGDYLDVSSAASSPAPTPPETPDEAGGPAPRGVSDDRLAVDWSAISGLVGAN